MRHRVFRKRLGRQTGHRLSLLRNLVSQLFLHEKIITTYSKAKEASRMAQKIINLALKEGDSKRRIYSLLGQKEIIERLFEVIVPRVKGVKKQRKGGFTRVLKLAPRKGDGAPMAVLLLVD